MGKKTTVGIVSLELGCMASFGTHLMLNHELDNQTKRMNSCAKQLGPAAVQAAELPKGCETFSNDFKQLVSNGRSVTDTTVTDYTTRTYVLVSKDNFLKTEKNNLSEVIALDVLAGLAAVGATIALYSAGSLLAEQARQNDPPANGNSNVHQLRPVAETK